MNNTDTSRPWYAAMRDREDNDWGYGSYDLDTSKKMLRSFENPDAYIAVIENDVCVEEIIPVDMSEFHIDMDSFGSDLPDNWEQIAERMNSEIDTKIFFDREDAHDWVNDFWNEHFDDIAEELRPRSETEEKIEMLMLTGMSRRGAEEQVKQGAYFYEDTDDRKAAFIEEASKFEEPEETEAIWNSMDTVTYKGIRYRYDLVL